MLDVDAVGDDVVIARKYFSNVFDGGGGDSDLAVELGVASA